MDEQGMIVRKEESSKRSRLTLYYSELIDEFWLKEINEDRRKRDLGEVSSTMFEKIFDRLEKEWFDLVGVSLKILAVCIEAGEGTDLSVTTLSFIDQKHAKAHGEPSSGGFCLQYL